MITQDKTAYDSSWYDNYHWCREAHDRFGHYLSLPFVDLWREVRSVAFKDARVLDVGASVEQPWKSVTQSPENYFSMDVDPMGDFNYRTFDDVPEDVTFDVILMNQMLEHLTMESAFEIVSQARPHLAASGHLIATVPNTAHPVRQWTAPHVTAWAAWDLYGLFRSCGYDVVKMARYGKKQLDGNWIRRFIVKVVCDQFRVDWADSILLAATVDEHSPTSIPSASKIESRTRTSS
jgi:2-polyprenyl-3-methyl-5-hydroxy-6-metoxy-1,4-benzoquinol methylase